MNAFDAKADEVSIDIEIDSISDQDSLQITITDNGTGFTEESFGRFIELLNARDELHHGTGRLVYLNYFDYVEIDSIHHSKTRPKGANQRSPAQRAGFPVIPTT